MAPIFILVFSVFALIRFAVSQWRAIWITAANQPLSEFLPLAVGMDASTIEAQEFGTLLAMCDRLSPDLKQTSPWLKEVSVYYRVVAGIEKTIGFRLPSISNWAKREQQTCSRYVAVLLDQRLAMDIDRRLATAAN